MDVDRPEPAETVVERDPEQRQRQRTITENCQACGGPITSRNRIPTLTGSDHLEMECQDCNRHGLVSRTQYGRVVKRRGQIFEPHGETHHEH